MEIARGLAILACAAIGAHAQEFRPHAQARITPAQWQAYLDEVKSKHGGTEQQFREEHLVLYNDAKSLMSWAFTTPGHPAHPAWVTRQPVTDGNTVKIRQIGFYAGNEDAFRKLFATYLLMTSKMQEGKP
ncbi:MAG TPA: hypothetical protein VFE23_12135 [Usitatibacter sp.]|jgi:hypothetical protein|nr:hypothetical protein [Usitatibacter sp.]